MKFVALLRGINVGKSIQVPMKTLKGLLEELGLENVVTYLNSGNVLFESERDSSELTEMIENKLEKTFGQNIPTLVKTSFEIVEIEKAIPAEWHSNEREQTYVAYLFDDIARPEIISELPIRREYMEIFYTNKAIVWNIKKENYNRSHITKIIGHKSYSRMTTRNVNTARKLAEFCKEE
ncbi:DUF1697 domain-containing protein [Candidatus Chloroploca sp. M-50]|uniref:DUF1697 domain-containing protein n=1 Tax=Candidatus Chloroploca mongolica TaxID=2528176 RepID=A0ABS4D7W5_9CHLR|nr:DUF1697 domain-containing protein [Candidatus Chloroploca mongolica]MBP1465521.1 DUF1697 domain-containing protein [Candidatus Chloroploca mongolica]